MYLKFKQGV